MATEEETLELEEDSPVENKGKKVAKHDSGAADLEKVTDYVEEAEISSQDISNVRVTEYRPPHMAKLNVWIFSVLEPKLAEIAEHKTLKSHFQSSVCASDL